MIHLRPLTILALLTTATSTANAQATLVAHYKLDASSGFNVADASGFGHDGALQGGFTWSLPGAAAGTGTALELDGTSSYAVIPTSATLDSMLESVTVTAWMRTDTQTGIGRIFGNDGSWTFGRIGTSLRFTTRTILDYDLVVPSMQIGVWHHVAAVFDSDFDVTFYFDGQRLNPTLPGTQQANSPFPDWHIGFLSTGSPELWDGQLDDIQVYDGVLTDADITSMFQNPGSTVGNLGTNFCIALPNSAGTPAALSAQGNASVADQDVTLVAQGCPPNVSGIFFLGTTQTLLAFGDGFRCIALPINRIPPFAFADAGGTATRQLNFGAAYANTIQPGVTVSFQYWYRDTAAMGTGFNLSDAVMIPFLP